MGRKQMAAGVIRIRILGIPVDVIDEASLSDAIESLYALEDHRQIILLSFYDLMRAKFMRYHRQAIAQAAYVIPVSSLITWAAGFLKLTRPPLRRPYPFIIKLLWILEKKNKSVYLLGSTMEGVLKAEFALKTTFPGLRIVGRHAARFPSSIENDILEAIKKSSPTLLLAGSNLKGKHLWLARRRGYFSPGLSIWESSCFGVFSGRHSKPNYSLGARFVKSFFGTLVQPWRIILRFLLCMLFFLLVLINKFVKK
ncbi:hypothetical protein S1OALGB6SA_734 [Olavius algarvensis spirochete endosymbiont]|nr:MAG: hypothetical protein [Olavius algarvensis spirochete endosymbiont]VDA99663.1 hypothetical protein S1OALGB6SA_734 [Olavius algarvensis spirochete endosymbiont]